MTSQNKGSIIKSIVGALVILGIFVFFVNKYLNDRAREIVEREKAEQGRQKIESTLKVLVSQFNATDDWEQELSKGESVRITKILTIELEKLWLREKPILFFGTIENISSIDDTTYSVRLRRGLVSDMDHIFLTNLVLVLRCSKSKIDDLLTKHPQLFSDFGLSNNVAVIAHINELKTEFYIDDEGSKQESRVGIGDCLAIIHMGQIRSEHRHN